MPDTITDSTTSSEPTSATRCVFVYGTLRRGEQRDINLLLPIPLFMGYGLTAGVLYNLGAYPGVRLGGTHFVYGEVYQISPELERQLDAIEEVWPQPTGEYSRREVQVALTGREAASWAELEPTCLIYEIAEGRTAGMPVIVTGNWLDASL